MMQLSMQSSVSARAAARVGPTRRTRQTSLQVGTAMWASVVGP